MTKYLTVPEAADHLNTRCGSCVDSSLSAASPSTTWGGTFGLRSSTWRRSSRPVGWSR